MVVAVVYEEVEEDIEAEAFVESLNCEEEVEEVEEKEQKKVWDKEQGNWNICLFFLLFFLFLFFLFFIDKWI